MHDIRFVEDDWESPTLGAWGLGWEVWCDGMEVSQFTYFQQVGGFDCDPVAGELTYGLERLAMYIQGVDSIYELNYNGRDDDKRVLYGDVFRQAEEEYSRHNFEFADTAMLLQRFRDAEKECKALLAAGEPKPGGEWAAFAGAAGLRPVHQGEPHLQPARCARRHLRDGAAELYPARAGYGEGLLRGVAEDGGRRRVRRSSLRAKRSNPETKMDCFGAMLLSMTGPAARNPSLTLKPRIFFPPVRGFRPRFPHYAYHSAKRLQDALAVPFSPYPFVFI